jgi:hypothetical protein
MERRTGYRLAGKVQILSLQRCQAACQGIADCTQRRRRSRCHSTQGKQKKNLPTSMFCILHYETSPQELRWRIRLEALPEADFSQTLHDRYNKWGKPEFNSYTQDNAAAPQNWKQDSKAQSRNVLTGERPPSAVESRK